MEMEVEMKVGNCRNGAADCPDHKRASFVHTAKSFSAVLFQCHYRSSTVIHCYLRSDWQTLWYLMVSVENQEAATIEGRILYMFPVRLSND